MEHPHRVFKDELGVLASTVCCNITFGLCLPHESISCSKAFAVDPFALKHLCSLTETMHSALNLFPNHARRCASGRLAQIADFPTPNGTSPRTCTRVHNTARPAWWNPTKQIHDTLATCGWHATRCVSKTHGDDPVVISTANEGALCNECLVQVSDAKEGTTLSH